MSRPPSPPDPEFIAAWQASASIAEVCARLGVSGSVVYRKAARYRGFGVSLSPFCYARARTREWRDVITPEELSRLFSDLYPKLCGFLSRKLPAGADGEGIAVDVFVSFVGACEKGSEIENPEDYLYRSAENRIADYYRKGSREILLSETLPAPTEGDPHELAVMAERDAEVRSLLSLLTPRQAQAVALWSRNGLSVEQMAAEAGIPIGAFKGRLHRGLNELRLLVDSLSLREFPRTPNPGRDSPDDAGRAAEPQSRPVCPR